MQTVEMRQYFPPSLQYTVLVSTDEAVFPTIFTVHQTKTVYRWGGIFDYLYSAPDCIQMRRYFRLSLQCTRLYTDEAVFSTIFTVHQTVYRWGGIFSRLSMPWFSAPLLLTQNLFDLWHYMLLQRTNRTNRTNRTTLTLFQQHILLYHGQGVEPWGYRVDEIFTVLVTMAITKLRILCRFQKMCKHNAAKEVQN